MAEIVVSSWNELQDELFAESWDARIGRYRSRYAFRGLSRAEYPLDTTLIRLGGPYAELERHLLRNFRKYAHREVVLGDSIWHWLAVAQHYGLPTRLMDWTYSPFVAMHFATDDIDAAQQDGVIWAVNYVRAHQLIPDALQALLSAEGANVFTVEMLSPVIQSLEAFDQFAEQDYVLFFEPPSMDDRIVNQFAFFSVMPSASAHLTTYLQQHPTIWRKIVIPAALKWEIRDKLDQANITERVLMPGMGGLSRWLKRQYSPRTGPASRSAHHTARAITP